MLDSEAWFVERGQHRRKLGVLSERCLTWPASRSRSLDIRSTLRLRSRTRLQMRPYRLLTDAGTRYGVDAEEPALQPLVVCDDGMEAGCRSILGADVRGVSLKKGHELGLAPSESALGNTSRDFLPVISVLTVQLEEYLKLLPGPAAVIVVLIKPQALRDRTHPADRNQKSPARRQQPTFVRST